MNKMNLMKAGAALASLLLLVSCDPQTCGTAYITNNSSDTIKIERTGMEPKWIAPGQVDATGPLCGLGSGQTPNSFTSGTEKVLQDTTLCKRDIRNSANWTTTKPSKYDYEHRFNGNRRRFLDTANTKKPSQAYCEGFLF